MNLALDVLRRLGRPKVQGLRCLFEDHHLKITSSARDRSHTIVLCFTGVGHALGGIDVQKPEFAHSIAAANATPVFIFDKTRSWGNRVDFGRIAATVAPLTEGPVIGLGNSMGGFNAIVMSNHIDMAACVAFAPQFSLHPDIMPSETRWRGYGAGITDWRIPSLAGQFNTTTRYLTVNGDDPLERPHWSRFPIQPNAEHLVIRGVEHDGAAVMKQAGVLGAFLAAAFTGQDAAATLKGRLECLTHTGQDWTPAR